MWWHGLGVVEIALEVVGEAVTSTDTVQKEGSRHIIVKSETVDKGEEDFEEVGEGQLGMFFLE